MTRWTIFKTRFARYKKVQLVKCPISRHILATKRKIPLKNNFSQFCITYHWTNYHYSCGIVLLNLFFLTLVGCLPTRKRSLRKSMMTNEDQDTKTNLKSPENVWMSLFVTFKLFCETNEFLNLISSFFVHTRFERKIWDFGLHFFDFLEVHEVEIIVTCILPFELESTFNHNLDEVFEWQILESRHHFSYFYNSSEKRKKK